MFLDWTRSPYIAATYRSTANIHIASSKATALGAWRFAAHNGALSRCDSMEDSDLRTLLSEGPQGLAWKFNLPASEKWKVLKYLDALNINGFSLYGSEEGLMKTLAIREMHLGSRGCPLASKVGAGETALD